MKIGELKELLNKWPDGTDIVICIPFQHGDQDGITYHPSHISIEPVTFDGHQNPPSVKLTQSVVWKNDKWI